MLKEFSVVKVATQNIVNFNELYDKILENYNNSKSLINEQLLQYDKKIIENTGVVDGRLLSFQTKLDDVLDKTLIELRKNLLDTSLELKKQVLSLEEETKNNIQLYIQNTTQTINDNFNVENEKYNKFLNEELEKITKKFNELVEQYEKNSKLLQEEIDKTALKFNDWAEQYNKIWNETHAKYTSDINNKLNGFELNLNEMINAAISNKINHILISDVVNQSSDLILNAFNKSLSELGEKEKQSIIAAIKSLITPKLPINIVVDEDNTIEPLREDELFHANYEKLKLCVTSGIIPMIVGPAGTGKSTAAEQLARDLGLKFYMANRIQNTFELVGFVNAAGEYVTTQFYEAYKNGGIFLFDEVDASSPEALVTINAAIAQKEMAFPGHARNVKMHKDFKAICAGNTFGTGSTLQYTGRNKLDAATLDRFMIIEWDYDKVLEDKIINDKDLLSICWALRVACPAIEKSIIVSTRGIITLEKMLIANKDSKAFLVKDLFRQKFFENVSKANLKKIYNAISDECKGNYFLKYIGELSE